MIVKCKRCIHIFLLYSLSDPFIVSFSDCFKSAVGVQYTPRRPLLAGTCIMPLSFSRSNISTSAAMVPAILYKQNDY